MIRVAIVEDEEAVREQLLGYVQRYTRQYGTTFEVRTFSDGVEILEGYRPVFDLILLDVEMKHLDGMTTAERIRALDSDVMIVFITNMAQYAIKGYAVGALDYVLKPVPYFAFSQQLQKAEEQLRRRTRHYLAVPVEGGLRRLDTSRIYYIESEGHRVRFYTEEGDFAAPGALKALEEKLEGVDADFLMNEFTEMSLCCFRAHLAERYGKQSQRPVFSKEALWKTPGNVLEEYPVVLSTTYTARSSLGKYARFDYVVMDEASQVDVATGCLALSCARNAVIVGDTKQLPNVIASSQKKHLEELFEKYNIEDAYDFSQYSFLESLFALMKNRVPRVILREHYRCHPLIIGFCNQKFYNNELIVMTPDHGEKALKLVLTVPGQHERDRMNQRQIDVIKKDVLPGVAAADTEIGVIAPYRNQVYKLKEELNRPEIDISTVHKFQGREKDVIVLSTVDDIVTPFSDDPNLLNVAVSRAKKELVVVASEMEQPAGSNMGELIDYIRYHNCDVQYSAVSSVFDYLYKQYRDVRLDYLQKRGRISEFDSENLVYHLIRDELYQRKEQALDVVFHQPLYLLIRDLSKLDNREKAFVNSGVSHLDFLIYNRVSKRPILAIEVDGYRYHKEGTKQAERDKIKDDILAQYGVPLVRFATNGSDEARILSGTLDEIMGTGVKKD